MPEDKTRYDGLRDKLQEFVAKNPHLTPEDVFIEAMNLSSGADPTQLLQDCNEPSLQLETSPEFEAYRFYCFGHRAHPSRIIRIQRNAGACRLVAKTWKGLTDGNEDIWKDVADRPIDEPEFHEIASQLALADFWNTRSWVSEIAPLNAVRIMIEGFNANCYHSINRSGSISTGLGAAFQLADRLAGFGETDQ